MFLNCARPMFYTQADCGSFRAPSCEKRLVTPKGTPENRYRPNGACVKCS